MCLRERGIRGQWRVWVGSQPTVIRTIAMGCDLVHVEADNVEAHL